MKKFSLFACLIALNVIPLVSAIKQTKRVRSKIKETAVSIVSKLFSAQTPKEGGETNTNIGQHRLRRKRIGLIAFLALAAATVLMPIPTEQIQAGKRILKQPDCNSKT